MISGGLVTLLALLIDRISGEPVWLYTRIPHPAVIFGKAIAAADKYLNNPAHSPFRQRVGGIVAVMACLSIFVGFGMGVERALGYWVGMDGIRLLILATLASSLIASKSLFDHVSAVLAPLSAGDLAGARAALSKIVGRETKAMDEPAVSRAATESLAENFSDGIVAPVFWLALAGLPGIIAYKLVNTADSMIGHRNEKYQYFGWAAARLDDALNLIPARLNALLFVIAALLPGYSARGGWRAALADARRHASSNAGWPEAALAGALGVRVGGPRDYASYSVDGHWLNESGQHASAESLRRALGLARHTWWALACMLAVITFGGVRL